MKIIILGAGQVGGSLAETLISENHDITLVDQDSNCLQHFAERLDIRTVNGHCCYPGVLRQAGAEGADMIIAVTSNDEANIVACQVAYTLFNVPTKMARIRSRHYFVRKDLFGKDRIPIDVLVSPELIMTELIRELIVTPGALRVMTIGDGVAKILVLRPHYGGALLGKTIAEVYKLLDPTNFNIIAIYRNEKQIQLSPETEIEIGDRLYVITATENITRVISAFRREEDPYEKIMIAGGGNIGGNLARVLQNNYSVKLVDHNRQRCEYLSSTLNNVTVLCADANDSNLLLDENIDSVDVFLALTNDDEANIIASIQAKHLGARQTFAVINRKDYFNLIESGTINVRISPSLVTMGAILTHVRQGDIKAVFPIRRGSSEVIEACVHGDHKTSKLVERQINQVKLSASIQIVAIVRTGTFIVPEPTTRIHAEDRLVFFVADKKDVREVEKLLSVSTGFF